MAAAPRLDSDLPPPVYLLDDDLLPLVHAFLYEATDLLAAFLVSRRWRACDSDALWARLIRREHGPSKDRLLRKLGILTGKKQYVHLYQQRLSGTSCKWEDLSFVLSLQMHEFSSGATGPWAKQWGELNSDELAAAMLLGYRDHVLWRDRNKASADESAQDWEFLSEAQQRAATLLGYDQARWNSEFWGTEHVFDLTADRTTNQLLLAAEVDGSWKLPASGRISLSVLVQHKKQGKHATLMSEAFTLNDEAEEIVDVDEEDEQAWRWMRYDLRAVCLPWLPNRSVRANLDFAEGGDKAVRRIELHDLQAFFVHQDQLHHEVVTAYTVWQAIRLLLR